MPTLLYGERSLIECLQYVDRNPIRAGIVERPENDGALYLKSRRDDIS
jgi:hypothetical protein